MYKQVIVVNKSLNMSPGKMAAMVAHGSIAYFTNWLKFNVDTYNAVNNSIYKMKNDAVFSKKIYDKWVNDSFCKIIVEAEDEAEMRSIIECAQENGFKKGIDYFNIVDDSTEFYGIPEWAVIGFRPMDSRMIDKVTGYLPLYGHGKVTS